MNERIKALAKKHNLVRWDPDSQSYELNGDIEELYWFAELMVKECIDCARGAGLADDVAVRNALGFNDGISEAVIHMKKHFGVE